MCSVRLSETGSVGAGQSSELAEGHSFLALINVAQRVDSLGGFVDVGADVAHGAGSTSLRVSSVQLLSVVVFAVAGRQCENSSEILFGSVLAG